MPAEATSTQVMATTTRPILTTISSTCAKCGISKRSDTATCCAPGGSWFKKCGDPGDSNYEHTWLQGIRACQQGEFTIFGIDLLLHY